MAEMVPGSRGEMPMMDLPKGTGSPKDVCVLDWGRDVSLWERSLGLSMDQELPVSLCSLEGGEFSR